MFARKRTSHHFLLKLQEIKQKLEVCLVPKFLQGEKLLRTLLPAIPQKKLGHLEKAQQVYLGEKERERISAKRNTVIHEAKNIELDSTSEAKFGKESTMDQVHDICSRVYEIAT